MLACHSSMVVEAEYCWDYEEAAASTTNTSSLELEDLLKQNCGKTVAPAGNYMDLKLNIKTYCGLLWSIFFGPLQLLQGAPHDLLHPRSQGMLHYQTCLHKRGVCTDYVGSCGQWALILQEKILLHQTLQQERRSTSLSRTLRVSLTPSTMLIQFSRQHST
jgi:hypothetical protein